MEIIPYGLDLFEDNMWDRWFAKPNFSKAMSTDIIETKEGLKLKMDIPGVKKENIKITLDKGMLTIHASSKHESEEKDAQGNYIRKERHTGEFTRSFSVGEHLTKEDISAKLEDGTLTLTLPKSSPHKQESETIEIN